MASASGEIHQSASSSSSEELQTFNENTFFTLVVLILFVIGLSILFPKFVKFINFTFHGYVLPTYYQPVSKVKCRLKIKELGKSVFQASHHHTLSLVEPEAEFNEEDLKIQAKKEMEKNKLSLSYHILQNAVVHHPIVWMGKYWKKINYYFDSKSVRFLKGHRITGFLFVIEQLLMLTFLMSFGERYSEEDYDENGNLIYVLVFLIPLVLLPVSILGARWMLQTKTRKIVRLGNDIFKKIKSKEGNFNQQEFDLANYRTSEQELQQMKIKKVINEKLQENDTENTNISMADVSGLPSFVKTKKSKKSQVHNQNSNIQNMTGHSTTNSKTHLMSQSDAQSSKKNHTPKKLNQEKIEEKAEVHPNMPQHPSENGSNFNIADISGISNFNNKSEECILQMSENQYGSFDASPINKVPDKIAPDANPQNSSNLSSHNTLQSNSPRMKVSKKRLILPLCLIIGFILGLFLIGLCLMETFILPKEWLRGALVGLIVEMCFDLFLGRPVIILIISLLSYRRYKFKGEERTEEEIRLGILGNDYEYELLRGDYEIYLKERETRENLKQAMHLRNQNDEFNPSILSENGNLLNIKKNGDQFNSMIGSIVNTQNRLETVKDDYEGENVLTTSPNKNRIRYRNRPKRILEEFKDLASVKSHDEQSQLSESDFKKCFDWEASRKNSHSIDSPLKVLRGLENRSSNYSSPKKYQDLTFRKSNDTPLGLSPLRSNNSRIISPTKSVKSSKANSPNRYNKENMGDESSPSKMGKIIRLSKLSEKKQDHIQEADIEDENEGYVNPIKSVERKSKYILGRPSDEYTASKRKNKPSDIDVTEDKDAHDKMFIDRVLNFEDTYKADSQNRFITFEPDSPLKEKFPENLHTPGRSSKHQNPQHFRVNTTSSDLDPDHRLHKMLIIEEEEHVPVYSATSSDDDDPAGENNEKLEINHTQNMLLTKALKENAYQDYIQNSEIKDMNRAHITSQSPINPILNDEYPKSDSKNFKIVNNYPDLSSIQTDILLRTDSELHRHQSTKGHTIQNIHPVSRIKQASKKSSKKSSAAHSGQKSPSPYSNINTFGLNSGSMKKPLKMAAFSRNEKGSKMGSREKSKEITRNHSKKSTNKRKKNEGILIEDELTANEKFKNPSFLFSDNGNAENSDAPYICSYTDPNESNDEKCFEIRKKKDKAQQDNDSLEVKQLQTITNTLSSSGVPPRDDKLRLSMAANLQGSYERRSYLDVSERIFEGDSVPTSSSCDSRSVSQNTLIDDSCKNTPVEGNLEHSKKNRKEMLQEKLRDAIPRDKSRRYAKSKTGIKTDSSQASNDGRPPKRGKTLRTRGKTAGGIFPENEHYFEISEQRRTLKKLIKIARMYKREEEHAKIKQLLQNLKGPDAKPVNGLVMRELMQLQLLHSPYTSSMKEHVISFPEEAKKEREATKSRENDKNEKTEKEKEKEKKSSYRRVLTPKGAYNLNQIIMAYSVEKPTKRPKSRQWDEDLKVLQERKLCSLSNSALKNNHRKDSLPPLKKFVVSPQNKMLQIKKLLVSSEDEDEDFSKNKHIQRIDKSIGQNVQKVREILNRIKIKSKPKESEFKGNGTITGPGESSSDSQALKHILNSKYKIKKENKRNPNANLNQEQKRKSISKGDTQMIQLLNVKNSVFGEEEIE